MRRGLMGLVSVGVALVVTAYFAYGGLLYSLQEMMIFPAPGGIDVEQLDQAAREVGATPIRLTSGDGTSIYAWHKDGGGQRAVLYLHGNASTVAGSMGLMRAVTQEGWDFAVVSYRGYPGSEGKPSEAGIALDVRALWDYLVDEKGIAPGNIVVHGRSLGGGFAAKLAESVHPGALVLESTFTSVLDLAAEDNPWYPVSYLLKHPLNTRERAARIDSEVLVMHGTDDHTISVSHGRALAPLFPNATYVEVPGRGHGDDLPTMSVEGKKAYFGLLERVAP